MFLQVFMSFYASCVQHDLCDFPCVCFGLGFLFVASELYLLNHQNPLLVVYVASKFNS